MVAWGSHDPQQVLVYDAGLRPIPPLSDLGEVVACACARLCHLPMSFRVKVKPINSQCEPWFGGTVCSEEYNIVASDDEGNVYLKASATAYTLAEQAGGERYLDSINFAVLNSSPLPQDEAPVALNLDAGDQGAAAVRSQPDLHAPEPEEVHDHLGEPH